MNLDLAVINSELMDEHGDHPIDVGVRDGVVALIAERGRLPAADATIDAHGLWLLPGFVDAHFHCRAPDHPEREDFASGTAAAAAGGVTTLLEMPIADVGVTQASMLEARRALADRDAYVDFGLFGACGTLDREAIHGLAEAGAVAYKVFMHRSPPGRDAAFEGMCLTADTELWQALMLVRDTGLVCAFHAEDDALLQVYERLAQANGLRAVDAYLASRPPATEAMAVARLVTLAEATGAHVHIVHVTSAWAVDIIRAARRRGVRLTAETCPHYLLFDEGTARRLGTWVKVAPPLRSAADCKALWTALKDGTLDFVASDHAPFSVLDKEALSFESAPSGVPNVEVFAPLTLSMALAQGIPFSRAVSWLTAQPARVYGLFPRKGSLAPGSDADMVLFDPHAKTIVDTSHWFSKARGSARAFDGLTYCGRIVQTIVRGRTVYQDGAVVGQKGWGELVRPKRNGQNTLAHE